MALALPDRDDATRKLLSVRLHAGLLLRLLAVVIFSLTDPLAHADQGQPLLLIDALEVAVVLGGLWLARYATTSLHVIAIAFTVVSILCIGTALSGIIVGDTATAPVLLL